MGELVVLLWVGYVAAGRNVEIVQFDRLTAVTGLDRNPSVARILLVAPMASFALSEGQAREEGDTVISLLAMNVLVAVA